MSVHPRGRDPVYRCPKGGLHKWGGQKKRWWIIGWFPLTGNTRLRGGNTRRCSKCGTTMSADGIVETLDE